MVTSPGPEPSLGDVALNLATVCAETGQRVALVSTSGLASPADSELAAHHSSVVEELAVPRERRRILFDRRGERHSRVGSLEPSRRGGAAR